MLQTYLSHAWVKVSSLNSDLNYIEQNASRITRGLFEICRKKGFRSEFKIVKIILTKILKIQISIKVKSKLSTEIGFDSGNFDLWEIWIFAQNIWEHFDFDQYFKLLGIFGFLVKFSMFWPRYLISYSWPKIILV